MGWLDFFGSLHYSWMEPDSSGVLINVFLTLFGSQFYGTHRLQEAQLIYSATIASDLRRWE